MLTRQPLPAASLPDRTGPLHLIRGTFDRPEPSRSRQARFEDPRAVRPRGNPSSVGISAANTNDAEALRPLMRAIPAVRSRRGPRRRKPGKLHADKAYDTADLRRWVGDRGIGVRIARRGIESSQRLGRHRWVIERTMCAAKAACRIPGSAGRNLEGGSWV